MANIAENDVYIPPGLLKSKQVLGSLDNIYAKVDTPDGKNSFHATAMGVYQERSMILDEDYEPALKKACIAMPDTHAEPVAGEMAPTVTVTLGKPDDTSLRHEPMVTPLVEPGNISY